MATFHFDLVSPEKLAFSGEVDQVDVPGVEGDFGVLAGHAPVVAAIRPGILTVTAGGAQQKIIVLGGLAEVSEKGLTVLADVATSLRGTGQERVRRHRFPAWKPSSPRKRAPNSIARSSGSIISRASRASSIRRRCINDIAGKSAGSLEKPSKYNTPSARQMRKPGCALRFRRHSATTERAPGLAFMKRKIAAIFAADIAGYSRLVAEDEEETLRRLASYRQVTDDFIAKAGGRIFNTAGDAVLAEFPVPSKRCGARSISRRACAPGTWRIPPAAR